MGCMRLRSLDECDSSRRSFHRVMHRAFLWEAIARLREGWAKLREVLRGQGMRYDSVPSTLLFLAVCVIYFLLFY